jgi:hypothetical protein
METKEEEEGKGREERKEERGGEALLWNKEAVSRRLLILFTLHLCNTNVSKNWCFLHFFPVSHEKFVVSTMFT